jgi:hypothetical protein
VTDETRVRAAAGVPLGPHEGGALADALAPLDRRGFLRLAGLALAAGLAPSGCARALPEWMRPPATAPLRVLSARSYAVLAAASARLVGGEGAAWIAAGRVRPAATADAWLAGVPALAGPLSQGLALLEWGVVPLLGKLRPFTALRPAAQDAVLAELLHSRLALKRDLFRGLRSVAYLTFYADPAVRPLIGHPGPFGRGDVPIGEAMRYEVAP